MANSRYSGKQIVITGGTGSFGHTVAKKLLETDVEQIRILSRDEAKQDAMRHELPDPRLKFYVGDVRDFDSVARAMKNADYVFHAAALKQVPSCEFFPIEAVRTNILGSENVVRAAEKNSVSSVVCLSTDKAVYPVNAMGMSKAMMEKVAQSYGLNNPNAETVVSCVRYGNVMYSRGSVIPLFINQIKAGKQLTVTNPDMTRFLMSLADSVNLVEFAFENARQGDLFVKKAQASTIADLAQAVANLFESESEIRVIGTRHAEKLSEALATREELTRAEDMGDYFKVPADNRDLNYSLFFESGDVNQANYSDYDSHTVERMNVREIENLLLTLPEVRRELAAAGKMDRIGAQL
ncbi:SDR family NAD(P)-dependent oxidoreductase [Arthrobacter bambusae]|uniref:UDP-glucose 4-epimerase n=1 Tax=Arthrobacter bambusae TaxID=1338426 RepID=A0AAW8DIJ0_9MICC|nr:SDR family NAD(P)-dependent oxidoreductase [Arthrobacter bambusae]MDP9904638.1 UDP-glucose 4-epimerase [Arthrobacter bambusae]MDQ0129454.1 UDP-glucose 4-epimerase [Arthrobacter bambusae]MDQ0180933.1 UDP-glucose 4-epimerase [Arthrobacter bambusae]